MKVPDKAEVMQRLRRVNAHLQMCLAQRARLDQEIALANKKREFLMSLVSPEELRQLPQPMPPALPAPVGGKPGGQVEVNAEYMTSPARRPVVVPAPRPVSLDELLKRAQTQIDALRGASRQLVKATQDIATTLDIVNNVIELVSPEGRRQLAQIGQALAGALASGFSAPTGKMAIAATGDAGATEGGDSQASTAVAADAKRPDLLGLLSFVTSPEFLSLLSSLAAPAQQNQQKSGQ